LTTLVSYIDPANQPSMQLAQQIGAVYEQTINLTGFGEHRVYRHPPPVSSAEMTADTNLVT
jgi:RimJ/RimL family protein N-acetyltransferase